MMVRGVQAMDVSRRPFGNLSSGQAVELITLSNSFGVELRLMTLGASVQAIIVPDGVGKLADVTLGYDDVKSYEIHPQYFGATVGRFANRIANGQFELDGKRYQLPINNAPNSLHGGSKGFDKVVWSAQVNAGNVPSVVFRYQSPDGDQGYPGALTATATYSLSDENVVTVEYRATADRPTIVSLSNHTYFNLAGEGSSDGVMRQLLTLPAAEYTPVDATLIPTGEFRPVSGTVFDFRQPKPIGQDLRDGREEQIRLGKGFDHNWVISRTLSEDVRLVAKIDDPVSGRGLHILSNQPGIQFYSGNLLDGTVIGKSGHAYRQGDAFALEPQLFPDTPNQPKFGSARLQPGQLYLNKIVYRFSAVAQK
jgi:aldose 1-epimerase